MKLYELTGSYAVLQQKIEDGADSEALAETLEALEGAIEEKVEGIYKVRQNLQAMIDALDAEEKRLAERKKSLKNELERLKEYTVQQLSKTGIQRVKTKIGTVSIKNSQPSLELTVKPKDLPEWVRERFCEIDWKLKREPFKKYLLEHPDETPEGVRVVADKLTVQFR